MSSAARELALITGAMRGARLERAKVVAWLYRNRAARGVGPSSETVLLWAAEEIEAGAHEDEEVGE